MTAPKDDSERTAREHVDDLLDQALEGSFPASDPASITQPRDLEDPPVDPDDARR